MHNTDIVPREVRGRWGTPTPVITALAVDDVQVGTGTQHGEGNDRHSGGLTATGHATHNNAALIAQGQLGG